MSWIGGITRSLNTEGTLRTLKALMALICSPFLQALAEHAAREMEGR